MVGIKKLGCLGVLSRKTSKNPQKDESYQEGFRTDPYLFVYTEDKKKLGVCILRRLLCISFFLKFLCINVALMVGKKILGQNNQME